MKIQITIVLLFLASSLAGQAVKETIPKVYFSDTDTIRYEYSLYPDTFPMVLVLGKKDTVSAGTDNARGIVLTAFIGKDTLRIPGGNYPYAKRSYVTIKTSTRQSVVVFKYNGAISNFSQAYIEKYDGKTTFEIPEVYELANIIWTLSPAGQRATDLNKNTAYYKKAEQYFKPYLGHPLFKKLDFTEQDYFGKYYSFRENSFTYKFQGDSIVSEGSRHYVTGNDWDGFSNLFSELLPLVENFARTSNFRKFYTDNQGFYTADIRRVQQLLPVKHMWEWLEKEFPGEKYNAYRIVFSPLTGGSHSTQKYFGKNAKTKARYGETVMFICDASRYDVQKEITEQQKEGLMSGVVFTEIDHNYVNPVSSDYQKEIAEIFGKKGFWASDEEQWYRSPMAVFNEYMTHAVFCIWVNEKYNSKTAAYVIEKREELNTGKRKFYKFREFNQALLKLRKENPGLTVKGLYPRIIEWSKEQVQ